MKKLLLPLASLVGIIAFFALLPMFDPPQPRGTSITRADARRIADAAARGVGIEVDQAWTVVTWRAEPTLNEQFSSNPELRRRADLDPVVGPRLASFQAIYYRRDQPKVPLYGFVEVSRDGRVLSARRIARPEVAANAADPSELRRRADEFIATHQLPGAPNPVFESDRPTVQLKRTDHAFRYRVPTEFPSGNIVYLVTVNYIGDEFAGWNLAEEYKDGSQFEFDRDFISGTIARISLLLVLLLVLMVIFLRKYHEGEVGIGASGLLFAAMIVLAVGSELLSMNEASVGTQLGSLDASGTALATFALSLLFVQIPTAVLVFLAWAVGESYTRERWGERLASFDSILRRDPINANVGRSILAGVLGGPIAAAASLAVLAIPVAGGLARPGLDMMPLPVAFTGGAWLAIMGAASNAIIVSVVSLLFILGALRRRVSRPVALIIAIALGVVLSVAFGGASYVGGERAKAQAAHETRLAAEALRHCSAQSRAPDSTP